jgi:hypothetical protein
MSSTCPALAFNIAVPGDRPSTTQRDRDGSGGAAVLMDERDHRDVGAGGRLLAGTELHDEEQARGKRVLIVGYGKSACDVTVPGSAVARSTVPVPAPGWRGGGCPGGRVRSRARSRVRRRAGNGIGAAARVAGLVSGYPPAGR